MGDRAEGIIDIGRIIEDLRFRFDSLLDPEQDPAGAEWRSALAPTVGERELSELTNESLAAYIDHTLLKPEATTPQIDHLCAEAREYGFATVCVNPLHVARCARLLKGSRVGVATVVGFPLGATTPELKAHEAERLLELGATELDMVLNLGALREGDLRAVRADVAAVVGAAQGRPVKVILETGGLSVEEKVAACLLCRAAGAAFVKTSTGFLFGGATTGDVALMRAVVGEHVGVKASGGIRTAADARAMLAAGANRLGTSSAVAIVTA